MFVNSAPADRQDMVISRRADDSKHKTKTETERETISKIKYSACELRGFIHQTAANLISVRGVSLFIQLNSNLLRAINWLNLVY